MLYFNSTNGFTYNLNLIWIRFTKCHNDKVADRFTEKLAIRGGL